MRIALLLLWGFIPFIVSAQSNSSLEQQLQVGVDAYLNLEFEEGERVLSNVVNVTSADKYPSISAKAHCFLAECQYELEKYNASASNFVLADRILTTANLGTDTLGFYYRILLAKAIESESDPEKAASYQAVADWATAYPHFNLRIEGVGLYGKGMANYYRENYDQSFSDLEMSLKVQEPLGRDPFLGFDHSVMASLAYSFQDYYLAVTYQKTAVDLISTKRPSFYFRNLVNLAGYQLDNRSLADSRQTINKAKQFGRQQLEPGSEFWMMYYTQQQEYFNTIFELDSFAFYQNQAEDFYNSYPQYQESTFYHDHLNYATGLAIRKQEFVQAGNQIQLTFKSFPPATSNFGRVLSTLFLRSKVEIADRKFAKGVNSIQILLSYNSSFRGEALDPHYVFQAEELDAQPLVIEYLKDKASYYNQWDQEDSTKNWLELGSETIQLADSLIIIIKQKNNQPGLRKQLDEISRELRKIEIENYYRRHRRTGDQRFIELAVNSSEQVKHLIISERLHENIIYKNYGLSDELINKERAYSKQLADDLIRVSRGGTIDSLDVLQARISNTRDLQDDLRQEIVKNHPRFASLRYSPEPISLAKIRKEFISEDEVLLHFLERDSFIYLIGVTKEEQIFRRIRLSKPLAVTSPVLIRQMETVNDSVAILLRSHYREIMEPLEAFMQDKHLVVIPDAYLWHLPFPALITKDAIEGTPNSGQSYLIQERDIRHLFSLRVGMLQNSSEGEGEAKLQDVLSLSPFTEESFGNFSQLANSANTEELLKTIFGAQNGNFLSGTEATREAFLSLATTARLLHIFSHAQISEVRPDSSYLMFNPNSDVIQDGYLTALDIYDTKLSAQLAVLAACKTAGGKYYQGQGIANLARAFAHAGCENLVVNLWESKSEAIEELLSSFYPAVLEENKDGSKALAEAQRKFIATKPISAHPGYWGMAIYIGERNSMNLGSRTKTYGTWLLGITLLCLLAFARLARR